MNLFDALKRLNELLPERIWEVRSIGGKVYWQVSAGLDTYSGADDRTAALAMLEYALREEIEARGWGWIVQVSDSQGTYDGFVSIPYAYCFNAYGDSPAHALALALIEALETDHRG
ncbi:hypothetical protein [Deinococcus sp. SL84]|uniref:hypothetical protein n=1 Tax=Deinococcus sp. SL84 TaxID=2994663 RepID=UPI00227330A7|nr:hypothetical protein [Deinococcus sp. SL84]MCY1703589.1 hypothetical protein [Deinococcus sp. SL84]